MTNAQVPATTNGPAAKTIAIASPLKVMAQRFSIEPGRLLEVLKATVIKPDKSGRMASNEEIAAFVMVANEYGLNPLTRQLHAFIGKGGGIIPTVGVDGWAALVNRHELFDGVEFLEREDAEGQVIGITCVMHVRGRSHPVKVTEWLSECWRDTEPWRQMPRRMLRHKSFKEAARLCFGLSGLYDEDEARDILRNQPAVVEHTPEPVPPYRQPRQAAPQPVPEAPTSPPPEILEPEPELPPIEAQSETPDPVAESGLDQDELALSDFINDIDDAIRSAQLPSTLEEVGQTLVAQRKWLGEQHYQTLLFRCQSRKRELAPETRRK